MSSQVQMDYLRKQLYLATRNCVSSQFRGDTETIKELRDTVIAELYNKRYDELTAKELEFAIRHLQNMNPNTPITFNQLKLMRYYSIAVALHEADLSELSVMIDDIKLTNRELRRKMMAMFSTKQPLPPAVISYLYKIFINPLVNKWMVEAGYKKAVSNPTNFYYERLEKSQAQHLITRFAEYHGQIARRDGEAHNYDYSKN